MDWEEYTAYIVSFSLVGILVGYSVRVYFCSEESPVYDNVVTQANVLPSAPPARFST